MVVAAASVSFETEPGATLTVSGAAVEIVPSLASIPSSPLAYSFIAPFFEPVTVATPAVNLIEVDLPKAVAEPELLLTVGALPPGLAEAPLKVRLCEPVYSGAVLPAASAATIVRLSATPADGAAESALRTRWSGAPLSTSASADAPAVVQERHFAVTTYR